MRSQQPLVPTAAHSCAVCRAASLLVPDVQVTFSVCWCEVWQSHYVQASGSAPGHTPETVSCSKSLSCQFSGETEEVQVLITNLSNSKKHLSCVSFTWILLRISRKYLQEIKCFDKNVSKHSHLKIKISIYFSVYICTGKYCFQICHYRSIWLSRCRCQFLVCRISTWAWQV